VWEERQKFKNTWKMVLPEWIEHSTSSLPMRCSTTELRQRISAFLTRTMWPKPAPGSRHRASALARRERGGNCHTTLGGASKDGLRRQMAHG
jgi:hypothetical protein